MIRYPPTTNRSLSVRSAADDLLIDWATAGGTADTRSTVLHDRFGVVALSVPGRVSFVPTFHSQLEALRINGGADPIAVTSLIEPAVPFTLGLLRVPKSFTQFDAYLRYLTAVATPGSRIACGFMTRHFSPRLLEIARTYAGRVSQSRAVRKARLLHLEELRPPASEDGTEGLPPPVTIAYREKRYWQYPGVFSEGRIDSATRFLLERWDVLRPFLPERPAHILDIGCGNGVIGDQLSLRYPRARLTAFDDQILAVASCRLNVPPGRSSVHWGHRVEDTGAADVDLAVTNPPFHLGHETNIEISLSLFRQACAVLSPGGVLVVVANRHLNYRTHLEAWYRVEEGWKNEKFVIYVCRKP